MLFGHLREPAGPWQWTGQRQSSQPTSPSEELIQVWPMRAVDHQHRASLSSCHTSWAVSTGGFPCQPPVLNISNSLMLDIIPNVREFGLFQSLVLERVFNCGECWNVGVSTVRVTCSCQGESFWYYSDQTFQASPLAGGRKRRNW